MMNRIRLANARGCLSRRSSSAVQSDAVEILMIYDRVDDRNEKDFLGEMRDSILRGIALQSNPEGFRGMFPHLYSPKTPDDELEEFEMEEFESTAQTPRPEEIAALISRIGTSGVSSLAGNDEGWV